MPERWPGYGPLSDWPAVRAFPLLDLFGALIALLHQKGAMAQETGKEESVWKNRGPGCRSSF